MGFADRGNREACRPVGRARGGREARLRKRAELETAVGTKRARMLSSFAYRPARGLEQGMLNLLLELSNTHGR